MTTLWLNPEHANQIESHVLANPEIEACGLLLGEDGKVTEVVSVENISDQPEHHYQISPQVLSQHLPQIIGFYHSHPDGDSIPSETDKSQAWLGDTIYLIIGNKNGKLRYSAWHFLIGRVIHVPIHINVSPPVLGSPLSNIQKVAIIVSTVAALIILVTVAFELLPPAPPIP